MANRFVRPQWWSGEIARLIAEAAIDALIYAHRNRDTGRIVRLLTMLPRERQWQYAQWIHAHSPIRVGAVAGKIFAKFQKPGDALFKEFDLLEAARTISETRGHSVTEPLTGKDFAKKLRDIDAYIVRYGPRTAASDASIKQGALSALTHAKKHGNVGLMRRVVENLPHRYWECGFRSWLYTYSPIRRDPLNDRFYQAKPDSPDFCPYDLAGASRAAIISNRATISVRRLFDDEAYSEWVGRLSAMSHLEILTVFEHCVSEIVAARLQDSPPAKRIVGAFTAEWRLRSDMDDYFRWPSTDAAPGVIPLSPIDAPEIGIFAAVGYRVGKVRGQPDAIRLFLLNFIFSSPLPPLNGAEYMRPWGIPNSATRLKKMAYFLASEIKNAKRKVSQDMSVAISQWSNDYNYLYRKYYVDKFRFALPPLE